MKPPLHLCVAFHPDSERARSVAAVVHAGLDEDPSLPGLHVPSSIAAIDANGWPEPSFDPWPRGERVLVIALADEHMNAEPLQRKGARSWAEWVGDRFEEAKLEPERRRCVPIALDRSAWPLDPRLSTISFPRASSKAAGKQSRWVLRRVVLELLQFLARKPHDPAASVVAPVDLFVSHAKGDLHNRPLVFQRMKKYLTRDKPIQTWVDSAAIEGGGDFAQAIRRGIQGTTFVALRTDEYASRYWCREEVLLAKESSRPMVVVDALVGSEVRSFPYLGNAPSVRWRKKPGDVVALALKETLRHRCAQLTLELVARHDDTVLPAAPEFATIAHLPVGARVLYPDPPLGDEERDRIERPWQGEAPDSKRVVLETPWTRLARARPLAGRQIALSASPSHDPERYGTTNAHLLAATIRISHALILAGATLHYGGHLGEESYTLALFDFVRRHPVCGAPKLARIVNHVGWPLPLAIEPRSEWRDVAEFRRYDRPADVDTTLHPDFERELVSFPALPVDSALHRFAWARGMTEMRRAQTKAVEARVIIGGPAAHTWDTAADGTRTKRWYKSRIPGVVEESLCSIERPGQRVFLLGGFGGAARVVADEVCGRARPELRWEVQREAPHAEGMREQYEQRGRWQSYDEIRDVLRATGPAGLRTDLDEAEQRELMTTQDVDRIVALLLRGLGGGTPSAGNAKT